MHVRDVAADKVIVTFHCNCELFLMIVQKFGVGQDNEWDLVTECFEDGARAWILLVGD